MNESNRTVREAAHDVVVEILGVPWNPTTRDGFEFRGGVRRGRHRTAANAVRRGHLGASQAKGGNPIAPLKACVNVNNLIQP